MTGEYNAKIHHEQGGSVLQVESGGSINIQTGGTLSASAATITAASLNITSGGPIFMGNLEFFAAASNGNPTATASPGSIFIRSDGSRSGLYVNVSDGVSGSVWKTASEMTLNQ